MTPVAVPKERIMMAETIALLFIGISIGLRVKIQAAHTEHDPLRQCHHANG